jgi:hypothetical protein
MIMTATYDPRHEQPAARKPESQVTWDVHRIPLEDILRAANVHAPMVTDIDCAVDGDALVVTVKRDTT